MVADKQVVQDLNKSFLKFNEYGMKCIAAQILTQAVQDYKARPTTKNRRFFTSKWCDALLTICGLDITGYEIMEMVDSR